MTKVNLTNNSTTDKYSINESGVTFFISDSNQHVRLDNDSMLAVVVKIISEQQRKMFIECIKDELDINIGTIHNNVLLMLRDVIYATPDIKEDEDEMTLAYKFKSVVSEALETFDVALLKLI